MRRIPGLACALAVMTLTTGTWSRAAAQDRTSLAGVWIGALRLELPFRVVLRLRVRDTSLTGTMDFPDQNANGLPLSQLQIDGDSIRAGLASADVTYLGRVVATGDSIIGVFSQGQQRFPLVLRRATTDDLSGLERPQTPRPPLPYRSESVSFPAENGIVLRGTLVVPKEAGPHPAVLLLPGTGPLDLDATVAGHRPFLVLADVLVRRGFAVLRYVKRGVPPSGGNFASATTADFASDAEAALRFLRQRTEVDPGRVALFGHSEGAIIGAMVAGKDPRVAGTVLFGGPGTRGDSLMVQRASKLLRNRGTADSLVRKDAALRMALLRAIATPGDSSTARQRASAAIDQAFQTLHPADGAILGYDRDAWIRSIDVYLSQLDWFRSFFALDPTALYRRMHGPVLALYGELDWQVPPARNVEAVRSALKDRKEPGTVEVFPRINHQMQTASSGSPEEYGRIAETIAPAVIDRVVQWMLERVARQ